MAGIFFPLMADVVSDLADEDFDPVALAVVGLLSIPTVASAVFVVRSALMLLAAVPDLFVTREVEGVVLRHRRREKHTYVAVDDGTRSTVRAWRVDPTVGAGIGQGSLVRATVRPRLGHVLRIDQSPGPNSEG